MERTKRIAVFMAFGTKGDAYPIAAIAAAFATDQNRYDVAFITHSAHENLSSHLAKTNVIYVPISSPPVLSTNETDNKPGRVEPCRTFPCPLCCSCSLCRSL